MIEPISGESLDELVRQHGFGDLEWQVLIDFAKLEPRGQNVALGYVKYPAANARLRTQKAARTSEEEADAFAATAREQFITATKRELQASPAKKSAAG